jgi:hypothetical protein
VTNLSKREKILAAAAGALVLATALALLLLTGDSRSRSRLRADRDRLAAEVEKKQAKVDGARRALAQLTEWERRALPTDAARARSLYQNWLRELADRAQFRQVNIDSGEPQIKRNAYTLFSFTVRGRTSLVQLAKFFHEFYSAGHLQQLRRLDVKPVEKSTDVDVILGIEALLLPGADRTDKLSTEPGNRLKSVKLSDYGIVAARNLFAPPVSQTPNVPFDAAQLTFVTAILEVDGKAQVWLLDRTAGKTFRLGPGEKFEIGPLHGSVVEIGRRDVVLELDGKQRRLTYGDHLRAGTPVDP